MCRIFRLAYLKERRRRYVVPEGDHTPNSFGCCSPFSKHATLSLWECSSTSLLQIGHRTSFSCMSLCLWAQAVMPSSECSFRVLPQIAHSPSKSRAREGC